jgi:hypothetical protein
MASIFLSFDRQDEARARPIAALLERADHSVWCDRQIKGGRYSTPPTAAQMWLSAIPI